MSIEFATQLYAFNISIFHALPHLGRGKKLSLGAADTKYKNAFAMRLSGIQLDTTLASRQYHVAIASSRVTQPDNRTTALARGFAVASNFWKTP